MSKKVVVCCIVAMSFYLFGAVSSFASVDAGPADITMVNDNSKKPKPAIFPHKKHQDSLKCGECHHSMGDDGKQIAYVEGQEIKKCGSCHNKDVLAGKTMVVKGKKKDKTLKLDTLKGAAHGNCVVCHKAVIAKDPALKAKKLAKCSICHPKKKK